MAASAAGAAAAAAAAAAGKAADAASTPPARLPTPSRSNRLVRVAARRPPAGGFFLALRRIAPRVSRARASRSPRPGRRRRCRRSRRRRPRPAPRGQLGAVVLLAQVGGDDVAQAVVAAGARISRRGVVGQVAEPPADARLQRRRVARLREQRAVVVALEQQRVAALQVRQQVRRDRADVGQHAQVRARRRCSAAAAAPRVVRHGEGLQLQVADRDRPRRRARSAAGRRQRRARRCARQVPRLIHSGTPWRRASVERAADVVAVLVGDEHRVEVVAAQPGARQPRRRARAARSRSRSARGVVARRCAASTSVALPLLPLPRLQKRIARRACAAYFRSSSSSVDDALAGLARSRARPGRSAP